MIFTLSTAAQVRAGKVTAILLPVSEPIRPNTLKQLRRAPRQWTGIRLKQHRDQTARSAPTRARAVLAYLDGPIDTSTIIEKVDDINRETGERVPVMLTILSTDRRWTDETTHSDDCPELLTDAEARQCGYMNVKSANFAWQQDHPRSSPLVQLVTFSLGDLRDQDRHLQYGAYGGGYTASPSRSVDHGDAPAVDAITQQRITEIGTLKWRQQRELALAERAKLSLAQRIRDLERAQQQGDVNVRDQLRVIRARLAAIQRKAA